MASYKTIGFVGLGVMGEPICRNLVKKSGAPVIAFDLAPEPLKRLGGEGAAIAGSVPKSWPDVISSSSACPAPGMCAACSKATAS